MLWLAGATNPKTKTSGLPFPHGKSCKSKGMVAGTPVAGQATYQGHLLGSYSTPTSWTPKWQTFRTVFSLCKVPSLVLFHVSGYWTSRGMFWLNLFWKPMPSGVQNEGLHLLYESFPVRLCLEPQNTFCPGASWRTVQSPWRKSSKKINRKSQWRSPVVLRCSKTVANPSCRN